VQLLIARDPRSATGYLLRLPLDGGIVFRTPGTWPRGNALRCRPVPLSEWPDDPEIVERADLRSCVKRGASIDLVLDRERQNRSRLVLGATGDVTLWQSPNTSGRARSAARPPAARGARPAPPEAEVRSWARAIGLAVPDRGRLRPEVWDAWYAAHGTEP
jgi:hypothetical protein